MLLAPEPRRGKKRLTRAAAAINLPRLIKLSSAEKMRLRGLVINLRLYADAADVRRGSNGQRYHANVRLLLFYPTIVDTSKQTAGLMENSSSYTETYSRKQYLSHMPFFQGYNL